MVTRFKELISDCFASEANEENQGWLSVKLVKAWVAKNQKRNPFTDAEFDAQLDKMVNEKKVERDGDKISY